MTDYLHEKTALLPSIELRDHGTVIEDHHSSDANWRCTWLSRVGSGLINEIRLSLGVKNFS